MSKLSSRFSAARLAGASALLTILAACGGDSVYLVDVPNSLVVADINGDGHPDVVSAIAQIDETGLTTKSGYMGVFLNSNGTSVGSFSAGTNYTTSPSPPSGIAMGDIMGTGGHDIVVANNAAGTLALLTETSPTSGQYNAAKVISLPSGSLPNQIFLADIDGDGALDIVVADGNNALLVLLQNSGSRGSFSVAYDGALPTRGVSVAAADLNGDGLPDIVVAGYDAYGDTGYIQVFNNTSTTGKVVLTAAPQAVAVGCEPSQVRIFDLAASKAAQAVQVADENTNSIPAGAANLVGSPSGPTGTDPLSILAVCQGGGSAVTTDGPEAYEFADNHFGLMVVPQTTATNSGTFGTPVIYPDAFSSSYGIGSISLAVGDIDGDGLPDVVMSSLYPSGTGAFVVMPQVAASGGGASGTFGTGSYFYGLGQPVRVQLADVNADGYLDIVVADTTTAGVLTNNYSNTPGSFNAEYQIGY